MIMEKDIKKQEIETNKLLLVFGLVFLGIFTTMYLEKMSDWPHTFMLAYNIINVLSVASLVATIISFIKYIANLKKGICPRSSYINAKTVFCVSAVILICSVFVQYFTIFNATKYIYAFLPAVAVLYFILVTYSREVFVISFTNIFTIVCTYYLSTLFYRTLFNIVLAVIIIFLVSSYIIISLASKENTKSKIKDFLYKSNFKLLKLNIIFLILLTILAVIMAFIGFNYGYMVCIVYFAVMLFYNTLKIL